VIEGRIHDDTWYLSPSEDGAEVGRLQTHWNGGMPRLLLGTELDPQGGPLFGIEEDYETRDDGTIGVVLKVAFQLPRKAPPSNLSAPHLSMSPSIDTVGGTLAGGWTAYYAISASDNTGNEGPLSFVVPASIPAGTTSNQVELRHLRFPSQAQAFSVYRGDSPQELVRIADHVPVADTFRDSGLVGTLVAPADQNYDHAKFEWRLELYPEVAATYYTAATIGSDEVELATDEFAGKIVRLMAGKGAGQERVIVSHDSNTLLVAANWAVIPDSTTRFAIVESSWNFGATSVSSPASFTVPNRGGCTVQVLGLAVSAQGVESSRESALVTRWRIGGKSVGGDDDVPPAPVFGVSPSGRGSIEVIAVGFGDLVNTRTVRAATLTLHYWNELNSPCAVVLQSPIDEEQTLLSTTGPDLEAGDLLQVDSEILEVEEAAGGGVYAVRRASHNSVPAEHNQSTVYRLDRKAYVIPFPEDFFGSPASGSFTYPLQLPNVRVAAAEMFMTNSRGNGETRKVSFTATIDEGIRTYSGGQYTIQVDGFLAVQTATSPPIVVDRAQPIRDILAVVRDAPTGDAIHLAVRVDDELLCNLSIPAGQTASDRISGFGLTPLPALSRLTLDIVSVGFAIGTTPGRDLTVTIRL
jgi:hypothetical protein